MTDSSHTERFKAASATPPVKPKRPSPFTIRLSDDERARLERERGALSLAAYIRLKLFTDKAGQSAARKKQVRKHYSPSAELAVLGAMLGGLGKSDLAASMKGLSQAAQTGALAVTPDTEAALLEACADIAAMRRALVCALGVKDQRG